MNLFIYIQTKRSVHADKTYDEWLIFRIRTGEREAFKLLAKRWYLKLIRHIYFLVKDENVAKDIAQDTWSVVIKRINTLRNPEYFKTWIFRIASNKSADWIKQEQKRRELKEEIKINGYIHNSENEETNNDIEKLRLALQKLPDTKQHILNLFYLENCNIREISKILNIPSGTVKSRLFKAREYLKSIINT